MSITKRIKRIVGSLFHITSARKRLELLEEHFRNGLPDGLRPGLKYLITGERDQMAALAASEAEARRAAIAAEAGKQVPIWYSPKPGSAGKEVLGNVKPSPGKILDFTMESIAATGKNERWGTALHLFIRGFQCERGIELGSCAGISALYLSSAPSVKKLTTVEGSKELSKIAATSLRDRSSVVVVNSLFDVAIDNEVASETSRFDFAFIDGHHEKVATIHYFNRLVPYLTEGAVVIFDDISWSYDMREAWNELSQRPEFSHAIDLGAIGVCLMKSSGYQPPSPRVWNLQPITGMHSIGDPHGWKE